MMTETETYTFALGASGITIRPMGVGTNRWGSAGAARPELKPVFEAALQSGITLFDTAEVYGRGGSERTLARFLPAAAGKPVILTKFFPLPWRLSKGSLIVALGKSLERLGLAQVDLYLVHFPTPLAAVESWADGLADAVEAGLVRAVGVSNYDAGEMRRAHSVLKARGISLCCNEVEYNLLNRKAENNGVLDACRELGVALVAYRPLALGFLSAASSRQNPAKGVRGLLFGRAYAARIGTVAGLLRRIADSRGKTPAQVALNWVLCKGALPIPGATTVGHLQENIGALGWRLAAEEVSELDRASAIQE
jgi:aryl-alcohol dehydrogenase-like predicted oxidoreductase